MLDQSFFDTPQAAKYLGLSRRTLEKFRCTGSGPAYLKLGRRAMYTLADLDEWAMSRRRTSTSDPGPKAA